MNIKNTKAAMIQTKNLNLIPIQASDITYLISLYEKPEVRKELGGVLTKDQAKMRSESLIAHWKEYGIGFYMIYSKEKNTPMGYGGFRVFKNQHPDLEGKVEIGYVLDVPYWGQGYAKEAVQAWIKTGFEQFKFEDLTAIISPTNAASIAVVKKMGFEFLGQYKIDGVDNSAFRLACKMYD